MTERRLPGRGAIFLGIAVAAFATGPCLLVIIGAIDLLGHEYTTYRWQQRFKALPSLILLSSLFCLIGSVPAACLNAFFLNRAARKEMDSAWVSILFGAVIGGIVFVILDGVLGFPGPGYDLEFIFNMSTFAATGACMGLLHWLIAIRPRRRWRLRLRNDEEAIRAME